MDKIVKLNLYKRRIVDEKIEKYLKTVGAICIEGHKWFSKAWTSSYHSNSEFLVADPSLDCALLKVNENKLIHDLSLFGFLFEAFVERDLRIYADSFNASLYHYQDYHNNEIDAVIELEDGNWCAFEIKLGSNQIDSAAKNLILIKNEIEKNGGLPPKIMCVIVGLGSVFYKRNDGVYVVPINALKN